jgi:hypothetical protein
VAKLRTTLRSYVQTEKAREGLARFGWTADASGGEVVHKRIVDEQKLFRSAVNSVGLGKAK